MDFPADITLRKTRMKFELTFKVVLLFSYQGFCFLLRKLLYSITSTLCLVKNFFKFFSTSFSKLSYFLLLSLSKKLFFYVDANFYILSHDALILSRTFFIYLLRFSFHFFQINSVLMCNVCYFITTT